MTLLILIFSEIVPKTIGTYHWKSLTWLSHIMKGLIVILYPIVWLVEKIRRHVAGDEPDTTISREEVSAMANIGEEEGVIDNSENKVIQNIIKLDDIKAYDVMTPRVVAAIAPEYMTLKQFYKQEELSHYSRIPVYSDSPDVHHGLHHALRRPGESRRGQVRHPPAQHQAQDCRLPRGPPSATSGSPS
jgi:Hemolysins and related proteins containing CBS domains